MNRFWKNSVLVFLLLWGISDGADTCIDDDLSLCNLMRNRIPDFCSDPCLSKLCRQSCEICPITCYACTEVNDPSACQTEKTCRENEYCVTVQTFAPDFSEAYRLGCAPVKTCQQYALSGTVNAGCCNSEKCNNHLPVMLKIDQNITHNATGPTPDPGFCVNMDDDICEMVKFVYPHPCSNDCIASKLCPHMCQKCFYCLECGEVDHPDNCTTTVACGYGRECYGFEKLGGNNLPAVQLGCVDEKVCHMLYSPSGHVFGRKRDKFTFTGGCCIGDWCNKHPNVIPTEQVVVSTRPTISHVTTGKDCSYQPHNHCPTGFLAIDGYCYHIGNQTLTRTSAAAFCQANCAQLVKFSSKDEVLNIFSHFNKRDYEVFTSLKKENQNWIWETDNSIVSPNLLEDSFRLTQNACAVAYITYSVASDLHTIYTYGLYPADCNHLALPLCYTARFS